MRLVLRSGSLTATGQRQPCRRRLRRLLAALHVALALTALALLAPRVLAAAAGAHPKAVGHDCPQYGGSILDMPDTSECRRLMRLLVSCLLHHGQATVGAAPGADCCDCAASFFALQCHCWGSQFDTAAVMGVAAVDDACAAAAAAAARGAEDITLHPEADPASGAIADAAADPVAARVTAAAVAAATQGAASAADLHQLSRLREQLAGMSGGSQQGGPEPIVLHSADDPAAATASSGVSSGSGVRVFVGVLSAAARREARDAIRATWGSQPDAYRTRFFIARPADSALFEEVQKEAVEKRDLVVLAHITEHYLNITHQTLEVMRFAAADPAVTHVLKVDDDSYVHWERLMHRLVTLHSSKERMFWGHIEKTTHPQRNTNNPWYVSREEWPSDRYPPWAHGGGYVLSADLAAEVASGAAYAASVGGHLFKLEDVALASWLEWAAQRGGWSIHLVTDRRFNYEGCRFGDLVSHYIKPPQMRCMWGQQGRCKGC